MSLRDFQLAPETSTYQGLKLLLGEIIPIDRDILHIVLGAVVLLLCVWATGRQRHRAARLALILSLALAILMEALDARDDIRTFGAWRWDASAWDVLRTISVPLIAVILFYRPRARPSD